ncbi:MAG: ATP-binding protein [Opitutaceae bacterium]
MLAAIATGTPRAAASWPVVRAHDLAEERANGPVWAFAVASTGELIVGADQILVANHAAVTPVAPASGYAVRALAAVPDPAGEKIWYGAIGDLGWLERDATGLWRAHSLQRQLPAGCTVASAFWHAQATPEGVVFVAEREVLRWNGARMESWLLPSEARLQPLAFSCDTVWLAQRGHGLVRIGPNGPSLAVPSTELPVEEVVWLLPPRGNDSSDTSPLAEGTVLGAGERVYLRVGDRWLPQPALDAVLAGAMPVTAVRLASGEIAIGTFLRGIAVVAPDPDGGRVLDIWGRKAGLASEQVHALWLDPLARLWVGLPDGWACIDQPGRAAVFDERDGLGSEPVRRVLHAGGRIYAVQSRGAAWLRGTRTTLIPLDTVIWDAAVVGETLFAGGVGGIWRLDSTQNEIGDWVQERFVAADVFCLAPSQRRAGWMYYTEGTQVKALEATPQGWAARELGAEIGDTPVSLVEDAAGGVWVSTVAGGVLQYRLVEGEGLRPHLRRVAHHQPGVGLPAGSRRPRLFPCRAGVAAFTENQILVTNGEHGFAPLRGAEGLVGLLGERVPTGDRTHWLVARVDPTARTAAQAVKVRFLGESTVQMEPLHMPEWEGAGRATCLDRIDNTLWLGAQRGVLELVEPMAAELPPAIRWAGVTSGDKRLPAITGPTPVALGAAAGTLRFAYSIQRVATPHEPILYETRLSPTEVAWSTPQAGAAREFAGLSAGTYRFAVRAADAIGRTGPVVAYDFSIPTPWYRRWPAVVGAIIGLLLAAQLLVHARLERLRRQARRLNRLVEERTRELALANDAKTEFLANISHEIRNPLNGVSGLAAMLNELGPSGRAAELTRSLGACARSLNRVFEEVLAFSKLELGTTTVAPRVFELGTLVDDIAGVFAAQARERSVTIDTEVPAGGPWWFRGDDARLRTILENFVGNALRHAPGSPVGIAVEFGESAAAGADLVEVTFNVTDHGPGVPAAEQELIFRKFVRGTRARERGEPGAGLGLATCKLLAELLGGSVGIESEPGAPTTFYLRLQLERVVAPPAVPAEATTRARADATPSATAARALVVDDQEFNRLVAQRIAEQLGYQAEAVGDGAAAVAAFRREPYALVILDWELAGLNGGAVARELRALPGGGEAVILATTAHDSEAVRQACRDAGMDAFALKPIDEVMIARLVEDARRTRTTGDFDGEVFRYLARGEVARSEQLRGEFIEALERELMALGSSDGATLARAAHRLRSQAGLVRCHSLNRAAQALQLEAETASATRREELVAGVRARAAELRERLVRAV